MSRFHQRLRKRMENPEFAAGYREMSAELAAQPSKKLKTQTSKESEARHD
jgi:hypothetical protein